MNAETPKPKEKRRGHNEGTGYQRADGRWEWKISFEDGSRKSFYATTQRGARQKARTYLDELEDGLDPAVAKLTVAAYLDRWLSDIEFTERVRPSTLASYRGHVRRYIVPAFGRTKLRSLTVQQVNAMLVGMTGKGISPTTANLVRATLRAALSDAKDAGYVSDNIAKRSAARPVRRQRVQPLTTEQARHFIDLTKEDRLGALFHMAITTGMRQGELLALTWDDVDLDAGVVHVRATVTMANGKLTRTAPKTDQSQRSIRLTRSTVAALRRQGDTIHALEQLATNRWQENNLVFPSAVGTFLGSSNVTHHFQSQLQRHGLPRQRFHDLRHCAASVMLAEGLDLFTVKEILGHSQISLTANTYGHLSDKLSEEAARRMELALGGGDDN